jgi:hypothetical protein
MGFEELDAIWRGMIEHPRKFAVKLFPSKPQGYVKTATLLAVYASDRLLAMRYRAGGHIEEALKVEEGLKNGSTTSCLYMLVGDGDFTVRFQQWDSRNYLRTFIVKTVIYLNRWNNLFHLMLMSVDGEESRRLDSRYDRSLEQVRKAVDYWRIEYEVAAEDIHDNSAIDLDDIFSWMDVDLTDDLEGKPW